MIDMTAKIDETMTTARVTSRLVHKGDVTLTKDEVYPVHSFARVCGFPAVWLDLGDETYAIVQHCAVTLDD